METGKVLFVDDEPAVLDGYQRLLHREIPIDTAIGGLQALATIVERGPYAVVVSDMRMPKMDGVQFLTKVRKNAPDTVRIALTGYADLDTASKAVNEGAIFRFLTKPCAKDTLLKAIADALVQHRLAVAERELLENTLRGAVAVLSEVLSYSNPAAFGKAMRLRRYVSHVVTKLQKQQPWRFEVAALLSQLGCVTLHPDTVNMVYAGEKLPAEEQTKFDGHPMVAWELLSRIPRMEQVAWMIAQQHGSATSATLPDMQDQEGVQWGALLLRLLNKYDRLLSTGVAHDEAIEQLKRKADATELPIVNSLADLGPGALPAQIRSCEITSLAHGMVLQEDICTTNGVLVAPKGHSLTLALILRLEAFRQKGTIPKAVRVQLASSTS